MSDNQSEVTTYKLHLDEYEFGETKHVIEMKVSEDRTKTSCLAVVNRPWGNVLCSYSREYRDGDFDQERVVLE